MTIQSRSVRPVRHSRCCISLAEAPWPSGPHRARGMLLLARPWRSARAGRSGAPGVQRRPARPVQARSSTATLGQASLSGLDCRARRSRHRLLRSAPRRPCTRDGLGGRPVALLDQVGQGQARRPRLETVGGRPLAQWMQGRSAVLGRREVRGGLEHDEELQVSSQRVIGGGEHTAASEHSDHQQLVAAGAAKLNLQVGAVKGAIGTLLDPRKRFAVRATGARAGWPRRRWALAPRAVRRDLVWQGDLQAGDR